MKAALNGSLNCSILDGWWDEWFTGDNGWAISSAERLDDLGRRDELEANSLFDLLEHQVVPLFYDRGVCRVPRGWTARIKSSLASLGPLVTATRMVGDYVANLYEPAARDTDETTADDYAIARDLAGWKRRVLEAWTEVRVDEVTTGPDASTLGEARTVTAVVSLGGVSAQDVEVQLVSGPVGEQDELTDVTITAMVRTGDEPDGGARYEASFTCDAPGRHGVTVRVVPSHPHLDSPAELGRMAWA